MIPTDPVEVFRRSEAALGVRFELERLVTASAERVLFLAADRLLKRRVSLRVNFWSNAATRAWFLGEAVALGRLDHPAIRHVYDVGVVDDLAYRVGNWVEGEGLHEAVGRGPRPIPAVHALARDLLSGLEHAHSHGVIIRRVVPASLILSAAGRGTITDLRFSSWTLGALPPEVVPTQQQFMAPEVRDGAAGSALSDVYTAGAILYYAVAAQEPPLEPSAIQPPSRYRPNCPRALERVILRALRPAPNDRYLTAAEMLEDFASEAGTFETAAVSAGGSVSLIDADDKTRWELRLRRALGDDYELLGTLGQGGFGRVYRVRDLHLEREV